MGKCMFMRKGEVHTVPSAGILLSDLAEGSVVKLNENGSPIEFYVAKHNYESALNGTGRTLLVRKNCYDSRYWNNARSTEYSGCTMDSWFNGDYKSLLDSDIQTAIGSTQFYYTPSGNSSVTTLTRSIFALSITELGKSFAGTNSEGSALPIASSLSIAYLSGSAVVQWTRSHYNYEQVVNCLNADGSAGTRQAVTLQGSRPAFTLPSTALFDKDTMILKGVA